MQCPERQRRANRNKLTAKRSDAVGTLNPKDRVPEARYRNFRQNPEFWR